MKLKRTWILIADGARARVLLNRGTQASLSQVDGMNMEAGDMRETSVESDRPGRVYESHGSARHAIEPATPTARKQKLAFARDVAARLSEKFDEYDRLIIIAPARTLGDLRELLKEEVCAKISATLAKDLTHVSNDDIPGHLGDLLHAQQS